MERVGHVASATVIGVSAYIGLDVISSELNSYEFGKQVVTFLNTTLNSGENYAFLLSIFAYYFGALLPDFDLVLKYFFDAGTGKTRYLYHRQTTHSILLWAFLFWWGITNHSTSVLAFYLSWVSLGVFTHLLADMITGSVPVGPYASYQKKKGIISKIIHLRIGIKVF